MNAVPALRPVIMPESMPIFTTDGSLLIHELPPVVASYSVFIAPVHIAKVPEMGAGCVLMVTTVVVYTPGAVV